MVVILYLGGENLKIAHKIRVPVTIFGHAAVPGCGDPLVPTDHLPPPCSHTLRILFLVTTGLAAATAPSLPPDAAMSSAAVAMLADPTVQIAVACIILSLFVGECWLPSSSS